MKGDEKLLQTLNRLLADELAAINQCMEHSEMCDNWGYGQLRDAIRPRER
jgi:bacterioferritin